MKAKSNKKSARILVLWKYAPPRGMWMAELVGDKIMVGYGKHMTDPFAAKLDTIEFSIDHDPDYHESVLENNQCKAALIVDALNKAKLRLSS